MHIKFLAATKLTGRAIPFAKVKREFYNGETVEVRDLETLEDRSRVNREENKHYKGDVISYSFTIPGEFGEVRFTGVNPEVIEIVPEQMGVFQPTMDKMVQSFQKNAKMVIFGE